MRASLETSDNGYTLIEVIIALTLAGLLTSIIVMVMRDGVLNAERFRGWFNSQTRLTKVVTEIGYGYSKYPGVSEAIFVTAPTSTQLSIIYNDASDRIVYYLEGNTLKRKRVNANGDTYSGSNEVLLSHVDHLSFSIDRNSLILEIKINQSSSRRRPLSVIQHILMRNI